MSDAFGRISDAERATISEKDYMDRLRRIEQMEGEILILRRALKPFAEMDFGGSPLPANEQIIMRFECSVRELNAARTAYQYKPDGEMPPEPDNMDGE